MWTGEDQINGRWLNQSQHSAIGIKAVGFSKFLRVLLPHVVPIFHLAVCCG